MKINRIAVLAALAFVLLAAGCTKLTENDASNGQTALTNVRAALGNAPQQNLTRAIADDDPTLTSIEDRVEENHAMTITIDGLSESYVFEEGKFIPEDQPVYFLSGNGGQPVDFWFGDTGGNIAGQDGTAQQLLAADPLTANLTFQPTSSLSGITLTHINSLIEIVLDADPTDVEDVMVGGAAAYNIPQTNRYLVIIAPGTDEFTVNLTYKNIPGYDVTVGKAAISGNVKEFRANNRYTLTLGIDEVNLTLRLHAISIDQWADGGTIEAVAPNASTTITLEGDNISNILQVKFTDGSIEEVTGGNGTFRFEVETPESTKVIYSIQRYNNVSAVGSEILIGRSEGEIISLKLSGNDVVFRDAINGFIPIGTYAELDLVRNNLSGWYFQEADLDLLGVSTPPATPQNWAPIGNSDTNYFSGIYDGGGFNIYNLNIYLPETDNVGLFGYCQNSTLQNIHIASGTVTGVSYIGGVCGNNISNDENSQAIISGCSNAATISGVNYNTIFSNFVGGICGLNKSISGSVIIKYCYNVGSITGTNSVGGVNGFIYNQGDSAIIIECYNAAPIYATANYNVNVGSVCGYNNAGTINYCFWGIGAGDPAENNATSAVGYNSGNIDYNYEFSATVWPDITTTNGYWSTDENGYWESLGSWNGNAANSTYPTLKRPTP